MGSSGSTKPNVDRLAAVASAARTATAFSAIQRRYHGFCMFVGCEVSAASGTSPTMDISILMTQAGYSVTLRDSGTDVALAQFTGTGNGSMIVAPGLTKTTTDSVRQFNACPTTAFRYNWAIAGTSPSFTFSIGDAISG